MIRSGRPPRDHAVEMASLGLFVSCVLGTATAVHLCAHDTLYCVHRVQARCSSVLVSRTLWPKSKLLAERNYFCLFCVISRPFSVASLRSPHHAAWLDATRHAGVPRRPGGHVRGSIDGSCGHPVLRCFWRLRRQRVLRSRLPLGRRFLLSCRRANLWAELRRGGSRMQPPW